MSAEKLAFLQNFYTDVTLYVPAEPAAQPPAASAPAPAAATNAAPPLPLGDRLNRPDNAPAARPGLPKSIPTASQVQLADRLASAAAPLPASPPPPTAPAGVAPVMLTPFTAIGNNPQGLVMLFRLPHDRFQKLHRNEFLNKMLQALHLVMADVMLVNVESELPVALANLRQMLAATQIIAFGKNLLDTTVRNTQIYEPVLFPSLNLAYLASATVDLVEYDVSLKKRLWPGLQRMFS